MVNGVSGGGNYGPPTKRSGKAPVDNKANSARRAAPKPHYDLVKQAIADEFGVDVSKIKLTSGGYNIDKKGKITINRVVVDGTVMNAENAKDNLEDIAVKVERQLDRNRSNKKVADAAPSVKQESPATELIKDGYVEADPSRASLQRKSSIPKGYQKASLEMQQVVNDTILKYCSSTDQLRRFAGGEMFVKIEGGKVAGLLLQKEGRTYTAQFGDIWYATELGRSKEQLNVRLAERQKEEQQPNERTIALSLNETNQSPEIVDPKPEIVQAQPGEIRDTSRLSASDWAKKLENDPGMQARIAELIERYFPKAKDQEIKYKVTIGEREGKFEVVVVTVTVGDKSLVDLRNSKYGDSTGTKLKLQIGKMLGIKLQAWLNPNSYHHY